MDNEVKSEVNTTQNNQKKYNKPKQQYDQRPKRPTWDEMLAQAGFSQEERELLIGKMTEFKSTGKVERASKYLIALCKAVKTFRPVLNEKKELESNRWGLYRGLVKSIDQLIATYESTKDFEDSATFEYMMSENAQFGSDRALGTLYLRWFCPLKDKQPVREEGDKEGFYYMLLLLKAYYSSIFPNDYFVSNRKPEDHRRNAAPSRYDHKNHRPYRKPIGRGAFDVLDSKGFK